jgi:hypothetical protein
LQDRGGEADRAAVMPRLQDSRQARGQFRDLGVPLGQANASNDLGLFQQLTGDNPAAAASHHQALQLYRDVGSWHGQAETLNNLGRALLIDTAGSHRIIRLPPALPGSNGRTLRVHAVSWRLGLPVKFSAHPVRRGA